MERKLGERFRVVVSSSRKFERGLVAPQAMIRRTHIRFSYVSSGGLVHRWPRIASLPLSLSLVTRLMVNGSTGNPLKTSRRKTRNRIDRGENWRRIDCYPDVPRMRIYPRGLRGTTVSWRINRFQPIQYQDYACTLQEVDVQWPRSSLRIWIIAPLGRLICGFPVSARGY